MGVGSVAALVMNSSKPRDEAAAERPHLPELRLHHALGYAIAGQLGYVLSQMAVLAALAQFRGPEAVGEFGLALALTTPAFMFITMGGKGSQASDVTQRYSFAEYAGLVIGIAALATIASIAAGWFLAPTQSAFLIVFVVALTKAAEAISTLSYGAFQQAGRADKVAISLLIRGMFTAALFALLLLLGASTAVAFLAQLLVWTILAIARDYPLASRIADGRLVRPSSDRRRIWKLARETAPLGASHLVSALLVSLPRLFVERSLGLSAVGLLTVVNYFQQAGTMLCTAIAQVLINRFARLRQRNAHARLKRTLGALFAVATAGSTVGLLAAWLAGEWVLVTLFGAEFGAAHMLLMIVAVAVCAKLFGTIPQSLISADRRYTNLLLRELAAVAICVVLLAVLVPRFGLIGAGYAIAATALIRLAMLIVTALLRRRDAPRADLDVDPDDSEALA